MFFMKRAGNTFVDRGDLADHDFVMVDFTKDGNWYTLDLSALIPVGVVVVKIVLAAEENAGGRFIQFRTTGNSNVINIENRQTQVAGQEYDTTIWVVPSSVRKIDYRIQTATWSKFNLTVVSWFK